MPISDRNGDFDVPEPVPAKELDADCVRRLDAAMDFIRRRFRDGIDLHDIARAAHYSPFHLHRLFHRHFGRTPKAVMNELQVAEAQRLMSAGTPLREVAFMVGFAHQSHFTSRFKMLTLTTPSRWLRGHRGRPALPPAETMPEAA
jgi:AraC-like DNA-binding protein